MYCRRCIDARSIVARCTVWIPFVLSTDSAHAMSACCLCSVSVCCLLSVGVTLFLSIPSTRCIFVLSTGLGVRWRKRCQDTYSTSRCAKRRWRRTQGTERFALQSHVSHCQRTGAYGKSNDFLEFCRFLYRMCSTCNQAENRMPHRDSASWLRWEQQYLVPGQRDAIIIITVYTCACTLYS